MHQGPHRSVFPSFFPGRMNRTCDFFVLWADHPRLTCETANGSGLAVSWEIGMPGQGWGTEDGWAWRQSPSIPFTGGLALPASEDLPVRSPLHFPDVFYVNVAMQADQGEALGTAVCPCLKLTISFFSAEPPCHSWHPARRPPSCRHSLVVCLGE